MDERQVCNRCVLDSSVPGIGFDDKGVCNYCKLHDKMENRYPLNRTSQHDLARLLDRIKSEGKHTQYDCIVGLSGGTDSTFCLYMIKKLGLRPLALHFDNGWVSEIAQNNIEKAVKKLHVDLKTVTVDWEQLRGYYLACLAASIPETCLACEVGTMSAFYETAVQENIGYIVLGTSFRTEGINPLRWHYIDGAYFEDVVNKYGTGSATTEVQSFNKLKLQHLINYVFLKRIKTIQLPMYLEYDNETIWKTLREELGWEYGGKQHFDCLYKPFGSYVEIKKFQRDPGKIALAALVRSKQLDRDEALRTLKQDSLSGNEASIEYCMERLGINREQVQAILSSEPKNFLHYHTYYSMIKRFGMAVQVCCKLHLVPETLYEKYFELV